MDLSATQNLENYTSEGRIGYENRSYPQDCRSWHLGFEDDHPQAHKL